MDIIYSDNEKADQRRSQLAEGLVAYNDQFEPRENWHYAAFYIENDKGRLEGGIHCHFEWDYAVIKHLWVALPRKGLGTVLLREAEKLAKTKNKKGVWLDTMEFQALGFYEKYGYKIFGQIPNAAGNYTRYFLIKTF